MDKIAVLIPCYNESKTVEKVVTDFRRVLPDAVLPPSAPAAPIIPLNSWFSAPSMVRVAAVPLPTVTREEEPAVAPSRP